MTDIIEQLNQFSLPDQANEAIALAQSGLEKSPHHPYIHYILGCIYDWIEKFDKAYFHHEQAARFGASLFHNLPNDYNYDTLTFNEVETACPLCTSQDFQIKRVVNLLPASPVYNMVRPIRKWAQCKNCQQYYAKPRPTEKILEAYAKREGERLSQGEDISHLTLLAQARLNRLIKHFGSPSGKTLLEIGCAYGQLIGEALKHGLDAYGVEISLEKAQSYLPQDQQNRIKVGNIAQMSFTQTYDAVCAFDLIEHLIDPISFIKKIQQLLKPNGLLGLSTPNYSSSTAIQEGRSHALWMAAEHIFYCNLAGLQNFIEAFGFTLLSSQDVSNVPGGVEVWFRKN